MAYTTIDDPSAHFQIVLWSGSGSGQAITNGGNSDLQPDFVWIKKRAGGTARSHNLYDSSRGTTKLLHSDGTDAEQTQAAGLTAFSSDGFTVGDDDGVDGSGGTYVAWQWKANGGTKTTFTESGNNPGGSYQVNTTAGFSILDYTGTGAVGTVAHGLGAVPEVMICKDRSSDGDDWFVYHVSTGNDGGCRLNTNGADGDDSNRWNDTTPTSSVCTFGASGGVNDDGKATIAYVFAPIQGYSKFGSYTGNGNADGTFVYTGFKPALVITKESGSTGSWYMHDTKRDPSNGATHQLIANTNAAEYDTGSDVNIDILSNGFKQRYAGGTQNGDGDTHIYMAFAEQPFVSSKGVPCTAR